MNKEKVLILALTIGARFPYNILEKRLHLDTVHFQTLLVTEDQYDRNFKILVQNVI